MSRAAPLALLALLALAAPAAARTVVVAIGNDRGLAGDEPLRYAERDATRFAEVMRRQGGVTPLDLVAIHGEDAAAVRGTLQRLNVQIRDDAAGTALVVYYSGHADAAGLHLEDTTLAYDELRALVAGSPAQVRVLIIDGCRSGGLTRVKGARPAAESFVLRLDDHADVEGFAVMTSSAATEDSHESDRLGGSFFTHHLIAALAGAGDEDSDGRVTLGEAYAYAARRTLASSGRTRQLQHPTYAYQLKGRDDFVMTRLADGRGAGWLVLGAASATYLVRQGSEEGPLVAEVTPERDAMPLSVPADDYFVQVRFADHYDEYRLAVAAGRSAALADQAPRRVAYARLVRKGGGHTSHGLHALAAVHPAPIDGHSLTVGAVAGYGLALAGATLTARARFGESHAIDGIDGTLSAYAIGLGVERLIDLAALSLGAALLAEGVYRRQTVDATAAPAPRAWGLSLAALALVEVPLGDRLYLRAEGGPITELLPVERIENGARAGAAVETRFGGFGAFGLGVRL